MASTRPRDWLASYRNADPFPARIFRKMMWSQASTTTSSTVAYQAGTEQILRLNSLFDPDLSGGTHQPYGFDTMASLYGRYVVHAVTIDISISQLVGQVTAYVMNAQPSNAVYVTTGNALGDLAEQPNTWVVMLDSAGRVGNIRKRFTIADLEGTTKEQLVANVEDYSALVTANPQRSPFLRIAFANLASTSAIDCRTLLRLEFEAEFYDRAILNPSS